MEAEQAAATHSKPHEEADGKNKGRCLERWQAWKRADRAGSGLQLRKRDVAQGLCGRAATLFAQGVGRNGTVREALKAFRERGFHGAVARREALAYIYIYIYMCISVAILAQPDWAQAIVAQATPPGPW